MRSQRLNPLAILMACVSAALITLAAAQLDQSTKLLASVEHWTADWRAALLADRAVTQHKSLAVVLIDDDAVAGLPYRSPIDRGLMARLVELLDRAGARVIALDFLFDQPTEASKDRQLIDAIRKAAAKVVLGSIDDRVALRADRRDYMRSFIESTGRPSGYLNLRYEIDGVIRGEADPAPAAIGTPGPLADSFAAAIARAAGAPVAAPAARIAWLRPPRDGSDTFMTIPAAQLLAPANEMERRLAQMLMTNLEGRIVLVGGDLSDHSDRHPTPISKLVGEPMPGVAIHAQALAQHLDGRHLSRIAPLLERIVTFVMAFAGFLLGWRFRVNSWITVTIPVILLLGVSASFLAVSRTIVPFAEPALAWAAAAIAGRTAMWLLGRRKYPSYEAS